MNGARAATMEGMSRRLPPLLLAIVLFAAACSGGDEPRAQLERQSGATTIATSTTTTTAPPPAPTTTTAPPAPELQALAGTTAPVVVSPTGVVLPVRGTEGDAVRVVTPCGETALLTHGIAVPDATVVLDPGHGGDEPGARGPNGLTENVLNLAVAERARVALEAAGFRTVLTRTGNYRLPLAGRAAIVKALSPKAFVSVHFNAEPDGPFPRPGSETYYQVASADSKRLAGLLYEEIVRALSQYQVPWVADTDAGAKYRRNARGGDYYGILRQTAGVPAVLAELGFISNAPEAELYARPEVQQVAGDAVARGIVRFLTTTDAGSGYVEPYPRETPAGSGGGSRGCVDPPLT